jgi:anti-repressor protein
MDLWTFLSVSTPFHKWIARRIEDFGFAENQDFVPFTENQVKGRPTKEYHLTMDMAKELSMVERNDKGKEARLYFLACERQAKQTIDPMTCLNDPAAMRGLLLTYTTKVLGAVVKSTLILALQAA